MKNISFKTLALSLSLFCLATIIAEAATLTVTLAPGQITNALPTGTRVTQFQLTATTATNVVALIVDSPTNSLVWTNAPFTNTVSYATNIVSSYTDFWGNATLVTNFNALFDNTNNVVLGVTNLYPQRMVISALAGASYKADGVNYYFQNGVTVTNTGSGTESFTFTYWLSN